MAAKDLNQSAFILGGITLITVKLEMKINIRCLQEGPSRIKRIEGTNFNYEACVEVWTPVVKAIMCARIN